MDVGAFPDYMIKCRAVICLEEKVYKVNKAGWIWGGFVIPGSYRRLCVDCSESTRASSVDVLNFSSVDKNAQKLYAIKPRHFPA